MKKLIYKDHSAIDSHLRQCEHTVETVQEIINDIVNSGLQVHTETIDLVELYQNPRKAITENLLKDKDFMVAGMNIKPEKIFDMLDLPTGTNEIIRQIEFQTETKKIDFQILKNLAISKNDVNLSDLYFEEIQNQHSIFIENDRQLKAWTLMETICKNLNDLRKITGDLRYNQVEKMLNFKDNNDNTANARTLKKVL